MHVWRETAEICTAESAKHLAGEGVAKLRCTFPFSLRFRLTRSAMDQYFKRGKPRAVPPPVPMHVVNVPARAVVMAPTVARGIGEERPPSEGAHAVRPRKRFRKKVNGLFGDQTDLKRRMLRLLRDTDRGVVLDGGDTAAMCQHRFEPDVEDMSHEDGGHSHARDAKEFESFGESSVPVFQLSQAVMDKLDATSPPRPRTSSGVAETAGADSDTPEFTATVSRALGSPEKLRAVRRRMGRLSPRSNDAFLCEMAVGSATADSLLGLMENLHERGVTPPALPNLREAKAAPPPEHLLLSPVSIDRTAAPAVLRRKVRRHDRGYRRADVLRARLNLASADQLLSSSRVGFGREDGVKSRSSRGDGGALELGAGLDAYARELNLGGKNASRSSRGGRRKTRREVPEVVGSSSEGAPPKKRRLRDSSPTEDDALSSNPFQLLVEAAAVEQKQSSTHAKPTRRAGRAAASSSSRPPAPRRGRARNSTRPSLPGAAEQDTEDDNDDGLEAQRSVRPRGKSFKRGAPVQPDATRRKRRQPNDLADGYSSSSSSAPISPSSSSYLSSS